MAARDGGIATMTHSLGMPSGVVTEGLGFVYNGCMGVFDPRPGRAGSIAPGKAADLAVDQIQAAVKEVGVDHTVKIVHEDDQTDAQAGVQAARGGAHHHHPVAGGRLGGHAHASLRKIFSRGSSTSYLSSNSVKRSVSLFPSARMPKRPMLS